VCRRKGRSRRLNEQEDLKRSSQSEIETLKKKAGEEENNSIHKGVVDSVPLIGGQRVSFKKGEEQEAKKVKTKGGQWGHNWKIELLAKEWPWEVKGNARAKKKEGRDAQRNHNQTEGMTKGEGEGNPKKKGSEMSRSGVHVIEEKTGKDKEKGVRGR